MSRGSHALVLAGDSLIETNLILNHFVNVLDINMHRFDSFVEVQVRVNTLMHVQ